MAYGDKGVDGGMKGTVFAAPLPWTEIAFQGSDAKGNPISRPKKVLLDTGANLTTIDADNMKGMQVTFLGAIGLGGIGGAIGATLFKGPTFKVQATKGGAPQDVTFSDQFGLSLADPNTEVPPILGVDLFGATGVTISVSIKAKTVQILL